MEKKLREITDYLYPVIHKMQINFGLRELNLTEHIITGVLSNIFWAGEDTFGTRFEFPAQTPLLFTF